MGKKDKFVGGAYTIENKEKTKNSSVEEYVSGFVSGNVPGMEEHISQVRDKVKAIKKRYPNAKVKWHELEPASLKHPKKKPLVNKKSKKNIV